MAKFQSDAEQKKWDALEGSAKVPMDKLLKGTASDSDIKKLMAVTEQYGKLAKTIFEEGLLAIEERADYLVQLAQEKRAAAGKKELTPDQVDHVYKASKKRAMKELSPELLETVEATLLDKIEDLEEKLDDASASTETHFDKLTSFLTGKPVVRTKGKIQDTPEATTTEEADRFWKQMDKREDEQWEESQAKAQRDYENRLLAEDEAQHSLLQRVVKTLTGKKERGNDELFGLDANGEAIPTRAATLDSRTDSAFMEALQQGERTNEELDAYLRYKKRRDSKEGNEVNSKRKKGKDDESWFAKIRKLMGAAHKKGRGDSGSWVTTLLEGLGLLIMSPQIIKMVGDKLSEYFSWDRLKDVYTKSIEYVKTAGASIISGVIAKVKEFLGIKDAPKAVPVTMSGGGIGYAPGNENRSNADLAEEAKTQIPALQKDRAAIVAKMQGARDRVEAAYQKGEKPNPDDTKILNSLQPSLDQVNTRIKQYQGAVANPASDQIGGTSKAANPEGTSGLLRSQQTPGDLGMKLSPTMPQDTSALSGGAAPRSGLADSTTPASSANSYGSPFISKSRNTSVGSATAAPFTPGLSIEPPAKGPASGIDEALSSVNQSGSMSPVNLGSFGITSGTSDLLHIINLGTLR